MHFDNDICTTVPHRSMTRNLHYKCVVIVFGLLVLPIQAIVDDPYFFGQTKKQRCNCEPNEQCNPNNGTCPNELCALPFVGFNCQHATDIGWSMQKVSRTIESFLNDSTDTTCVQSTWAKTVIIDIGEPLHFIWIFIFRKSTLPMKTRLNLYKKKVPLQIDSYFLKLDEHSLLIKLRQDVLYDRLELLDLPDDACSLDVSIGRNLAYSSAVSISSVSRGVPIKDASDTISGNEFFDVTELEVNETSGQWWRSSLKHDAMINGIQILKANSNSNPNAQPNPCGSWYIVVQMFASPRDTSPVFRHEEKEKLPTNPDEQYDIHAAVDATVKEVEFTFVWKGTPNCVGSRVVNLVEVAMFGEFRCPDGLYGAVCERHCPDGCARDICDPDWACPEKCLRGWMGPWCDEPRDCRFRYGPECEYFCANECGGLGECDIDTGRCLDGCKAGFNPPNCTTRCQPGTYDFNCSKTCAQCAINKTTGSYACDSSTGECKLGCGEGFGGNDCERIIVIDDPLEKASSYFLAGIFIFAILLFYKSASRDDEEESSVEEREKEEESEEGEVQPEPQDPEVAIVGDDEEETELQPPTSTDFEVTQEEASREEEQGQGQPKEVEPSRKKESEPKLKKKSEPKLKKASEPKLMKESDPKVKEEFEPKVKEEFELKRKKESVQGQTKEAEPSLEKDQVQGQLKPSKPNRKKKAVKGQPKGAKPNRKKVPVQGQPKEAEPNREKEPVQVQPKEAEPSRKKESVQGQLKEAEPNRKKESEPIRKKELVQGQPKEAEPSRKKESVQGQLKEVEPVIVKPAKEEPHEKVFEPSAEPEAANSESNDSEFFDAHSLSTETETSGVAVKIHRAFATFTKRGVKK